MLQLDLCVFSPLSNQDKLNYIRWGHHASLGTGWQL